MNNLNSQQIDQLAHKYGKGIPGLAEELKAKLKRDPEEENAEGIEAEKVAMTSPMDFEILPVNIPVERLEVPAFVPDGIRANEGNDEVPVREEIIVALPAGARPVARIRDNKATTEFLGSQHSDSWAKLITTYQDQLDAAIPAVGRIELANSDYPWVGTGWLIAEDIIVTNTHVAAIFARTDPRTTGYVFRPGLSSAPVSSDIDFLEEEGTPGSLQYPVTSILWLAPAGEADVAFLRISSAKDKKLPNYIRLADDVQEDTVIAAIGYPARDPDYPDHALVVSTFGDDVYEKKRLAPGKLKEVTETSLKHDCSTLGGNSGSVLLDIKTGMAVGLHQGGRADFSSNVGVPATYLRKLLLKVQQRASNETTAQQQYALTPKAPYLLPEAVSPNVYRMQLNIPIEISVKVGMPVAPGERLAVDTISNITPVSLGMADARPAITKFEAALQSAKQRYGSQAGVHGVRAGYRFKSGWITDEPAIVIEVAEKLPFGQVQATGQTPFPREIMGVGVDVRTAPVAMQMEAIMGEDLLFNERPSRPAGYTEPAGYKDPGSAVFLGRIKETMDAVFHVSPDAGFPNLKAFFGRVKQHLTATMYEWEPGNHISKALEAAMQPTGNTLRMVTQKRGVTGQDATEKAVADMKERIGDKFTHVWASTSGPEKVIPNAYHIKVASRDGEEVWLSSGNWKDSNQPEDPTVPNILTEHNREWHAIVKNERLATLFQQYIEHDFKQATEFPLPLLEGVAPPNVDFFVPESAFAASRKVVPAPAYAAELTIQGEELDIQPLLTPDRDADGNRLFLKTATAMLQRATKRIYIQNQSFALTDSNNTEFDRFFTVLLERQRALDDVRIIFRDARDYPQSGVAAKQQELIERIKDFGLDVSPKSLRLQSKCHTKGIIIDGQEILLGSQNLTNAGSLFNRDASLLVRSPKVAEFYEKIFLFDWEHLAHNDADEKIGGFRRATPDEATPAGFRRVKLAELLDQD